MSGSSALLCTESPPTSGESSTSPQSALTCTDMHLAYHASNKTYSPSKKYNCYQFLKLIRTTSVAKLFQQLLRHPEEFFILPEFNHICFCGLSFMHYWFNVPIQLTYVRKSIVQIIHHQSTTKSHLTKNSTILNCSYMPKVNFSIKTSNYYKILSVWESVLLLNVAVHKAH